MLPSGEVEQQEKQEVSFSTRNNPSNYIAGLSLETKALHYVINDPKNQNSIQKNQLFQ